MTRTTAVAALVALAGVLAGCGGAADPGGPTPPSPTVGLVAAEPTDAAGATPTTPPPTTPPPASASPSRTTAPPPPTTRTTPTSSPTPTAPQPVVIDLLPYLGALTYDPPRSGPNSTADESGGGTASLSVTTRINGGIAEDATAGVGSYASSSSVPDLVPGWYRVAYAVGLQWSANEPGGLIDDIDVLAEAAIRTAAQKRTLLSVHPDRGVGPEGSTLRLEGTLGPYYLGAGHKPVEVLAWAGCTITTGGISAGSSCSGAGGPAPARARRAAARERPVTRFAAAAALVALAGGLAGAAGRPTTWSAPTPTVDLVAAEPVGTPSGPWTTRRRRSPR